MQLKYCNNPTGTSFNSLLHEMMKIGTRVMDRHHFPRKSQFVVHCTYGIEHSVYQFVLHVQVINLLIVNQSMIDMCASFITLLVAVVDVDFSHMSSDSIYDQFVCRVWIARVPLWASTIMSTYGILITAFERYFAVIHPMWYNVSTDEVYFHARFRVSSIITKKIPKILRQLVAQ